MFETLGKIVGFLTAFVCVSAWFGSIIWLNLRWRRTASERARQLLHRWAARRNLTIIDESMIHPWVNGLLAASGAQRIFEVTVRDAEGRTRQGDVKCGHFIFGNLVRRVADQWKDAPPRSPEVEILPPDR